MFTIDPLISVTERAWRLLALTFCALACLYVSTVQVAGVDFWLQAKIGQIIATERSIPQTLLFPFTEIAEQPFNAHEWLSSLVFYGLLNLLGEKMLPFVTAGLGLALFSLVFRMALLRSHGRIDLALVGAALAIAVENYRHVLRPELLASLLLVAFWTLLEQIRHAESRMRTLMATLMVVIWVNTHGSFILAPLIAGAYAAGSHIDHMFACRQFRIKASAPTLRLASVAILAWVATCINPFGLDMLRFVFTFSADPALKTLIGEWMPTLSTRWLHEPGWWIALVVWMLSALLMLLQRSRIGAIEWLIFGLFTVLAIKAIRFPLYLGIVSAFLLSGIADSIPDIPRRRLIHYRCTAFTGILAIGIAILFGNAYGAKPYSYGIRRLGPELMQALDDPGIRGNVITSMELGAELIYRAYPRLRPSMDCRVDSYGMDYYGFQQSLIQQPSLLEEFVQRYDVRYMFYEIDRLAIAARAGTWNEKHWRVIAMDRQAALLEYIGDPASQTTSKH